MPLHQLLQLSILTHDRLQCTLFNALFQAHLGTFTPLVEHVAVVVAMALLQIVEVAVQKIGSL